jgi:glycosyltransferase involved in cell wall biosynthesis
MKLLYITNGINAAGGLERVLSIKASFLADNYGYEVTILSLNSGHLNPFYTFSDKIKMKSIFVGGNPMQYTIAYIKGIKNTVSELKPDVIAVCDDGLKAFFTPLILGKKIPIIYERHASIELNTTKSIKGKLTKFLMKQLAKSFSKFVVLTTSNINEWKTNNITVIHNPVSFYPPESSLLTNNKVIAVGSHSYNKGCDLLLQAWNEINQTHPDWKLEIFGRIDKEETYIKLAKKLGLSDSVIFQNPVSDIRGEYLKASIMVLPSRTEGFGMVLIEAMACGVPCVSFDCPSGPKDIIEDGEDGFLIENGDIEAFAKAIMHLIENESLRKEMGAKAKENVKRYTPDKIAPIWDELFKSIVK